MTKPKLMNELEIGGCFSWENESEFLADTLNIVNPSNILEIGFFAGASAFMWLHLSEATLISVDPMENLYNKNIKHDGKPENIEKLKKAFPNRFNFIRKDSRVVRPDLIGQKFDLLFIDGDHFETGVRNDFQLALDLNIPWILVDDFVTEVVSIYQKEFIKYFTVIRYYPRKDQFQGQPIPIVLMKRNNQKIIDKLLNSA